MGTGAGVSAKINRRNKKTINFGDHTIVAIMVSKLNATFLIVLDVIYELGRNRQKLQELLLEILLIGGKVLSSITLKFLCLQRILDIHRWPVF